MVKEAQEFGEMGRWGDGEMGSVREITALCADGEVQWKTNLSCLYTKAIKLCTSRASETTVKNIYPHHYHTGLPK
ncbi:MAG: hypothetical protein QNJ74_20670 [Trichodesmium sp. MO_231.B1]|nr:hypothetical protein [Trichodesmium sp. MO_231.B1]